jgi:hypothetical protein
MEVKMIDPHASGEVPERKGVVIVRTRSLSYPVFLALFDGSNFCKGGKLS